MASPPRALEDAAAWSWRLLVVGAAILATVLLLARLRLVVLPLFVAFLLATALRPVARFLEERFHPKIPKGFATLLAFLAFFAVLAAIGTLVGKGLGKEVEQVGPTVTKGIDDVQRWLVEGPLSLEQAQIDQFRQQASDSARKAGPGLIAPAVAVVEVLAGILLALITSFFLVKDGPELEEKALHRFPERHRAKAKRAGRAARRALGGYLKGAATLGAVEGVIIAVTIFIVGGRLAIPMLLLTFLGAFIPVVGAILSGAVAALVTLVTAGPKEALIVAIVAVVVQQLDNDLLAPFIYGRSVSLHPLAILLSIATGATLGGIAGTFLAVPVLAVIVSVAAALRQDDEPAVDAGGAEPAAPPGDGHVPAPPPVAVAPPSPS